MEGLKPQGIVKEASQYESVLEIGCGKGHYIKQVNAKTRVGIDIFEPAIKLAGHDPCGVQFIKMDASKIVEVFDSKTFQCIIGFDIIEHFDIERAFSLLAACEIVASECLMFFIPVGNHPQTKDDQGLDNDYYQTHRSSWYPDDMKALGYEVWHYPEWHKNAPHGKEKGAMCCRKLMA